MSNSTLSINRRAATWRGLSRYLGLIGALLAMIILFSFLSDHFLSLNTFSTIANQIPDLMVMSVGMTFCGYRSVGRFCTGACGGGGERHLS